MVPISPRKSLMGFQVIESWEIDIETLIFLKKRRNKEKNAIAWIWTQDLWNKRVALYQLSYLDKHSDT